MNYEEAVVRLEEIIKLLENNETSLNASINLYEEAAELIKHSYELIKNGNGKIIAINEKLEEIDFE